MITVRDRQGAHIGHAGVAAFFVAFFVLALAGRAAAFSEVSTPPPSEAAGHVDNPEGIAVDAETGRLYVADTRNNRIDAFSAAGNFEFAFGWGVSTGAAEFQICEAACRKGLEGAGKGQFARPWSVAVDNIASSGSRHDVYVADRENHRVQKFTLNGLGEPEFELTFGGGVDKTAPGNICTAASGHVCGAGAEGFGEGEFVAKLTSFYVAVGPAGTVYVADTRLLSQSPRNGEARVQRFEPDGAPVAPQRVLGSVEIEIGALAVDEAGDFYVADKAGGVRGIRKYQPSGGPPLFTAPSLEVTALAVDPGNDHLFAAGSWGNFKRALTEYDASGAVLRRFGYGELAERVNGLARSQSSSGDLYVSESGGAPGTGRVAQIDFPPPGPVIYPQPCAATDIENVEATLNAELNPEGEATTAQFEYVDQEHFESEGGFASSFTQRAPTPAQSVGGDFELHSFAPAVSGLQPETRYHCRVVATNAAGTRVGQEGAFETKPPAEFGAAWASAVGSDAATVDAEVNAFGAPAVTFFEYVDAASFDARLAREVQTVTLEGAGGGTFTLNFKSQNTALIPASASAAQVASALEALSRVKPGNVAVTGPAGGPYRVEFTGELADLDLPQLTANSAALTPSGAEASVATVVQGADGFQGASRTAAEPLPREKKLLQVETELSGLSPGTAYRFRLAVEVGEENPILATGPSRSLRTFGTAAASLPDGRGYELVSPSEKNGAEVAVPGPGPRGALISELFVATQAADSAGEAITYTSFTSFGEAKGATGTSQYLSRRGEGGQWTTENISPFGFEANPLNPPFRGFSSDLGYAGVVVSEPPCAPGAVAGFESLCLRDDRTGDLSALTVEEPTFQSSGTQGTNVFCTAFAGATADGSRAFFAADGAMAGAPAGPGFSLYEWRASDPTALHLVSVLPDDSPAPPGIQTAFGGRGGGCALGGASLRNVISANGDRIFWSYVPEGRVTLTRVGLGVETLAITGAGGGNFKLVFRGQSTSAIPFDADAATIQAALESISLIGVGNVEVTGSNPYTVTFTGSLAGTGRRLSPDDSSLTDAATELLVRLGGTETVQLDHAEAGAEGGSGNGKLWAVAREGTSAVLSAPGKLTTNAGTGNLYRYDVNGRALTDLTPGPGSPGLLGVMGVSDDASYVYYVATGVLAGENPQTHQAPQSGAANLYVWHDGQTSFVTTLAPGDENDWSSSPKGNVSRLSADGRRVAFVSVSELTGYDNTRLGGAGCELGREGKLETASSPKCAELYLFDAESGDISCLSCNPGGSRPLGPAALPGWSNPFEGPRYISTNGRRIFFESFDALSPADVNGTRDVYEFESDGEGDCSSASPAFGDASGGCVSLITSGTSDDQSYLLDASADGRDAFFATRQRLVGWDENDNYDVYDARVGGGRPEPPVPPVPCSGIESCHAPPQAPPGSSSSGTSTFTGPGNVKGAVKHRKHRKHRKKHGKHRRKGKHKGSKHNKHKGSKHNKHKQGRKGR